MYKDISTIFSIEDRDPDGYYSVDSGRIHSFYFQVPTLSYMQISFLHEMISSQDFSLRGWISKRPLENTLFYNKETFDFFPLLRNQRILTIWDIECDHKEKKCEDVLHLPASTYYFNILNLVNNLNNYKVTFCNG